MPTTSAFPARLFPLAGALLGTVLFGLLMVLAPKLAHQGFGWLMFNDTQRILAFAPDSLGYVTLMTGVLGAVMVGWALGLLALMRWLWHDAPQACWRITALSLASWFVIDTAFSLSVGALPNAVMNLAFAALYALGLWLAWPRQVPARRQTRVA